MTPNAFEQALQIYEEALTNLDNDSASSNQPAAKEVLAVLNARDKIAKLLENGDVPEVEFQVDLVDLDQKLKEKAKSLTKVIDWEFYRSSLKEKDLKSWWWYLEKENSSDWLWKGLTVGFWTVNIGFLVDIVPRFLMTGTGFLGVTAVTFPTLVTLLQARSGLTTAGKKGFDKLLERGNIPSNRREQVRLGTTFLMTVLLILFRLSLPNISHRYNKAGLKLYRDDKLAGAESKYLQALELDPDNRNAHYNLGLIYEDLQQFPQALKQYQFAAKDNSIKAQNNLGRLHVLNEEPDKAIPILFKAFSQTEDEPVRLRHNILKNLGWAFLANGQSEQANKFLKVAVHLSTTAEGLEQIPSPGSAHCLLAQSYEQQKQPEEAFGQWQSCCKLSSISNPDEVKWLSTARQKLREKEITSCN